MISYNSSITTDKLYMYLDPKNPKCFTPGSSIMTDLISNNVFTSIGNVHTTFNSNGWFVHDTLVSSIMQWRANLTQSLYNTDFTVQVMVKSTYRNAAMTWCFDNRRLGPILYYSSDYLSINTFDGITNKISNTYKIGDTYKNKWELVTCVFNRLANTVLYYSNKTYIGNALYRTPAAANNYFTIGGNNDSATIPEGPQYAYDGLMGPCLIYNKCLNQDEITSNANFFYSRYSAYN